MKFRNFQEKINAILINEIMLCGMNGLTLTSAEIIALKQSHRACIDKRAADQIKAVNHLESVPARVRFFVDKSLSFIKYIVTSIGDDKYAIL